MMKPTGMGQLLTIVALVVALVGIVLTYNGVADLRVVTATVFSVVWLSLAMLIYYRKSMTQRIRAQQDFSTADPLE